MWNISTLMHNRSRILNPIAGCCLAALLLSLAACSPASREARHMDRGKRYLEQKDYGRAVLEFRNARTLMPRDAEAHYHEGIGYLGLRNKVEAANCFRRATEVDPKHKLAQIRLAELLATRNSQKNLEEAEKQGKLAVALAPGDPDALSALALTEIKLGNEPDALRYLEQALQKFPQHLRSSMAIAIIKLRHKDFPGAEQVLKKAVLDAPKSTEARIALGELYLMIRMPEEAARTFQSALDIRPNDGLALQYLAQIQLAQGRKDLAEQSYRRLAALPDKQFRSMHANYLLQNGRFPEAIAELERLQKQDPADRQVRTSLVRAYVTTKRLPDAEKLLAEALRRNSKDYEALLQKAAIELTAGKTQQAREDLSKAIHDRPESADGHFLLARVYLASGDKLNRRRELLEAVRLNPGMLSARLELARFYTLSGTPNSALELLEKASKEQKQGVPVIVERNWALLASNDFAELRKGVNAGLARGRFRDLLVQDAILKVRNRDVAGARSSLEEILKPAPEDTVAVELLAQTYIDQKQPKQALEKVREYAALRPKSARLQLLLGRYLLAQGKADEARAAFLSAKAADPQFVAADLALVGMDRDAGRTDAARQTLSSLLASKDNNRERQLVAHLLLGDIEDLAGNRAAELEHWRKAVEADRQNIVALNNLAYLLLDYANKPDEALVYAQQAHELAPDNPDIEDTVGWALYRKGIYPMAVKHLEHAVSRDGKSAAAGSTVRKYHLAMAYFKLGNRDRGAQVLDAALKIDPNLPEARMAQTAMSETR